VQQSSDMVHTTNAGESFHSHSNSDYCHQHPHIFKIIEILKLSQVNTYTKIRTTNINTKAKIGKKYVEKKDFINENILRPVYTPRLILCFTEHIKRTVRRTFYRVPSLSNFYSVFHTSLNCISLHSSMVFSYFNDVLHYLKNHCCGFLPLCPQYVCNGISVDQICFQKKQKNTIRIKFYIIY
jgi:hypothetical protein